MNIKFTSNINQNGTKSKIAFDSKVEISTYQEFKVYEFIDPKTNVLNRIEIGDAQVNIFIEQSSLNLILNRSVSSSYNTPHGQIILETFMIKFKKTKNLIEFTYNLSNQNKKIGQYSLKLELGEI